MLAILRKTRTVINLARHAYCHRHTYARSWDSAKAFLLRLGSVEGARRLAGCGYATLGLRVPPVRVAIRRFSCDFLLIRDIFEQGEYAPAAQWELPEKAVILDLGANIGLAAVYFAGLRPHARLILVEPDAANLSLLRRNLSPSIDGTIYEGFAARADGFAGISREGDSWEFRKVDTPTASDERIRCFSVPTILHDTGVSCIDLLKCDIEGSEAELFADCRDWISRVRHLIVEVHRPYSPQRLYEDLKDCGWDFEVAQERSAGPHWVCFLRQVNRSAVAA